MFFKHRVVIKLERFLSFPWHLWGALSRLYRVAAEAHVTERESFPLNRRWGRGKSFENFFRISSTKGKVSKELDVFQGIVFTESLIHNSLLYNWGFSSLKTGAHFGTPLRVGWKVVLPFVQLLSPTGFQWCPKYHFLRDSFLLPDLKKNNNKKTHLFTYLFFKICFFKSRLSDPLCVCVEQPQLPGGALLTPGATAGCSLVTLKRPSRHVHSFRYRRPNHLSMKCFQTSLYKWNGNSERIYNSRCWDASNMGRGHVNWYSRWTRTFSPSRVIQSHVYSINGSVSRPPSPCPSPQYKP